MKVPMIGGIVLLAVGAFLLLNGGRYFEKHDVVKVGDIHITDTDSHPIPQWIGGALVVAGIVVVVAGAKKNS